MPELVRRTFRLHSPPDSVDTVQDALATVWGYVPDLSPADLMAAELAIVELAANVVQHANMGDPIDFTLTVVVYDDRIERPSRMRAASITWTSVSARCPAGRPSAGGASRSCNRSPTVSSTAASTG